MAGAGEFGHGNRREGGGEFRVISLAHGGLAVPASSSTGCRTGRARLVGSAAASAWASRGRVAAAMGQHIRPARCIAQCFHLAGGQADDFGEEGKERKTARPTWPLATMVLTRSGQLCCVACGPGGS
jgi:hypothetical protein